MKVVQGVLAALFLTFAAPCGAAAQAWLEQAGPTLDASHGVDGADERSRDAEPGHETDAPFDESSSDPTPSEGEEIPESADGETGYMPGPGVVTLSRALSPPTDMTQDLVPRDRALVSQHRPDDLERPPRA